jgi:hypothetical protein
MAARIGILSNCQHESLAIALRALLPDTDIVSLDLNGVPPGDAGRAPIAAMLSACDHVISQDIAPTYGPLSTRTLRATAQRYHLLPAFHFGGFHPDCVAVTLDHRPLGGPAGGLHSRIVIAGFLAGLSPEETTALFNPLVFARLGYFDALDEHAALLIEKFAAYAIDLSGLVPKWRAAGCFMTSPHHPKMRVFLDLARIACDMMGATPQADPAASALRDPLAAYSTVPFLRDIAARSGLQPEGVFRDSLPAPPLSLAAYVQGSYKSFARAPLSCLRAAPGVPAALARLGLALALRPKRSSASGPDARCLLSWHGTIVRVEAASSLLVHEKLWPAGAECSDFTYRPIANDDGTARAAMLGGLDIAPAPTPGTICIRRQGRAMVAEATRLAVPFRSEECGPDETFLPVTEANVADLRTILSQDWAWQGTPRRAAAARIRLRAGFILDFGIFAVNLTGGLPAPAPAGEEGAAAFVLQTPAGPITIRPAPGTGCGPEIALTADPARTMPNEAGSIPEFRTAVHASWSLAPPDEILHPPATAGDRDAAWVFERCTWPGGLPCGLRHHPASLRRMPDKMVLLSPGLEGLLFDGNGALTGAPPAPPARSLPAGLRLEEGALLIEAGRVQSAPVIDEPVAVCLSPNWRAGDGWLLDVALRLHAMAPFLPRGARLLVPPGFADVAPGHLALLDALGLNQWPVVEAPAPLCRLAQPVWLDNARFATMPAALLRGFRARLASLFPAAAGDPKRLFVVDGSVQRIAPNEALDGFLAAQGFTSVVPEALTPAARIALFRNAEIVIGIHGEGLANIVFCPDGARVLEISPRSQFRPRLWMLAEKCGLIHGVLPCAVRGSGPDAVLQVDVPRLRALFRVVRFTFDK